jgi:cytochrome c-type biogenesis protein CcmE
MNKSFALAFLVVGVVSAYLIASGMKESVEFYITPKELFSNPEKYEGKRLRVGGYVSSLTADGLIHFFVLTDGEFSISVTFTGVPPDLFGKAKGAIVEGFWDKENKVFVAKKIMAKHSEEYHPPEIKINRENK